MQSPKKSTAMHKQIGNHEHMNEAEYAEALDLKDKQIRQLKRSLKKCEDSKSEQKMNGTTEPQQEIENIHLQHLHREIQKNGQLEAILEQILMRIIALTQQLAQKNILTENSTELKEFLLEIENSKESSSRELSKQSLGHVLVREWEKALEALELLVKSFLIKFSQMKQMNTKINESLVQLQRNSSAEIFQFKQELKTEKKEKESLKKILKKTENEKFDLINRIDNISAHQAELLKAQTKQELMQFSKQLTYRVKDLQKQRNELSQISNKQKELQLQQYQNLLSQVRGMRERSKLGMSMT